MTALNIVHSATANTLTLTVKPGQEGTRSWLVNRNTFLPICNGLEVCDVDFHAWIGFYSNQAKDLMANQKVEVSTKATLFGSTKRLALVVEVKALFVAPAKDYEALYVKAFNNFLVNPDLHNVKVLCQAAIKVGLDVTEVRKYINDLDSVNAFANEVERVAVKTEEVAFKAVQDERTCFGYATSSLVEYAQVIVNDPNNEGVFDNNRYFQDPIKARLERKVEIKRGQRRAAKYAN